MTRPVVDKKHSDVLLFSTADWDNPFWTNKQHMARCFARAGYRVLYVDSLGLRRPSLGGRDVWRMARRLGRSIRLLDRAEDGIWRISPLQVPLHGIAVLEGVNRALLALHVRLAMGLLRCKAPIVWTYTPAVHGLIAALPRGLTVYHCVDDLRAAPGVNADLIESSEHALARLADVAFTTAPQLQERLSGRYSRCHCFPNVCDHALFRTAREKLPQPGDISHIPRPRAIFVGALSAYKVDFDLLRTAARRYPELHWLLIGQCGEGQPDSRFDPAGLANLHVLGPRPAHDLPAYLAHADVAVLPAPRNAYTASMFPMKFFEYLSAGRQVVSTDLPALREYADICFLAKDGQEFVELVGRVVFEGMTRDQGVIDAVCREQTWEKRFARMEEVFLPLIGC